MIYNQMHQDRRFIAIPIFLTLTANKNIDLYNLRQLTCWVGFKFATHKLLVRVLQI
jgi:hypothetical protein